MIQAGDLEHQAHYFEGSWEGCPKCPMEEGGVCVLDGRASAVLQISLLSTLVGQLPSRMELGASSWFLPAFWVQPKSHLL